jgi:acylphosphatase
MKQFTFIVSGNVQKAGYRDRVIELGKFVNLTGYAENLSDGRVRIIAEGEDDQLEFYKEHINIKNTLINVEKIEYTESEATGEFYGFQKLVSNDETDARLDTAANILKDVIVNMNRGFDKVINSLNGGFGTLADGQNKILANQELHIEITRNGYTEVKEEMRTGFHDVKYEIKDVKDGLIDVKNEIHMQREDFKEMFMKEVSELHIEINEIKATLARMQAA